MENQYEIVKSDGGMFSNDQLLAMAEAAEKRINAVIKIKQVALKVTNPRDWVNQDGNPYLMVSGAEKVANLFDISWRFLQPEPAYEQDENGHFTYTYQAEFMMGGRSIQVEGSRSSKDGFFKKYSWDKGEKKEIDVKDRDNKRDVKMAALTNLLGNGITRLLGIRNLTWEDLKAYAGIDPAAVKGFEHKKHGQPAAKPEVRQPERKSTPPPASAPAPAPKELQDKVLSGLGSLVELRGQLPEEVLQELSSFTDKEGKERHVSDVAKLFKNDKYTQAVYGKIKKELTDAAKGPADAA